MKRANPEKNGCQNVSSKGEMWHSGCLRCPLPSVGLLVVAMLLLCGCARGQPGVGVVSSSDISNFDRCVAAGYRVMRSYPPRCVTPDGRVFTQENAGPQVKKNSQGNLCMDQCGNRTCEQIVCMAEGCPCPEDPVSCPRDCALRGGAEDVW